MGKIGGPGDKNIRRATKKARKAVKSEYRRARLNNQNPRTGKPTRPAKKQGCLSLSAFLVLGVGGAVTGVILTVKGLA